MARKPAHWILGLAFGAALPVTASVALAKEQPTLAKPSASDMEVAPALATEETPTIAGPAKAAPITEDAAADATTQSSESTENGVEVIRERHPNSAVKVERHVTQDAEGNYYNHGLVDRMGREGPSGRQRRIPLRQTSWPLAPLVRSERSPDVARRAVQRFPGAVRGGSHV